MTIQDGRVRHVGLPRTGFRFSRPPRDVPFLLLNQENYYPDSAHWFDPSGQHGRNSQTLADYNWPTAVIGDDERLRFGLRTRVLPSRLTVAYHATREEARGGASAATAVEVMAGEGRAQLTRTGARVDVEVDSKESAPGFARIEVSYDLLPLPSGEEQCSSSAVYLIRIDR